MADSIEGVDELNNSIAELNRTLSYFSSSMGTASRTVGESTTRFDRSMSESSRLSQIRDENDQAREKRKLERDNNLNNAITATAYSLRSFGTAIVSAEQGFKKYGDSISRAGEAISNVSKNFGILGGAIGGAVRFVTSFASTALSSFDALVDFRDEVSKTSGAIPATLRGIQTLGMEAGYSGDRLKVLQKITAGLGTSLQGLGGVAGTGVVKFMQLADVSEDVRRRFGRMGVDQEQLTELQAKYVQMQAASGMQYQLQNKSMAQLRRESLDYADNMTKLSALTGKQADTLQQEQEQVQLEFEEQAAIMADQARIRQLREANRDAEADQLERSMNARKDVQKTLTSLLGPELASQMSRVFRTGFFDEKSGPLAQIMPELVGYSEKLKNLKPGEDADAITRDIFDTVKKKYEEGAITFETVLQVMGEEGAKSLGLNAKTFEKLNSYAGKTYDQLMAVQAAAQDTALKDDADKKRVADLREAEIALQRKYQEALIHLAGPMMDLLTSSMQLLNEQLDNIIPVVKDVGEAINTWIKEGGIQKLEDGFAKIGMALTWINDNKVLVGFGLAVLALTGPLVKLATFLLSASALFKGAPAAAAGAAGGGLLRGAVGLLGKATLVGTAGLGAYGAYQGYNADPTASLGNKLQNAGSSALSGVSFGLLGSSPSEIAEKAAKEKLNIENIVTHTNTVFTDTKQRKENIEQNTKLAKNTKEQMTEETRLFGLLTKAIKETTSSFLPFKQSIEDIVTQIGTNILTLQQMIPAGPGGTSQILATIKQRESGGDYKARTKIPGQTASGAYQFTNSTWQSLTKKYGIGDIFKTAAEAPPEIQDAVAARYVEEILQESGGDVSKVPLKWYTGNIKGKMSAANIALNNGLTPQMYQQRFMTDYSRMGANMGGGMGNDIVSLGNMLQAQGLRVSEHPAFGGVTPGVHKGAGHREGRAIDVNIGKGNVESKDPVMGARFDALANQLRQSGFTVLWRTEGHDKHMHVESKKMGAARGGVFTGPNSGYPIEMHGTEMVAPLNVDSILMKLAQTPVGSTDIGMALNSAIQSGSNSSIDVEKIVSAQFAMMQLLGGKLDSMLNVLESGNNTQSKILRHSMA